MFQDSANKRLDRASNRGGHYDLGAGGIARDLGGHRSKNGAASHLDQACGQLTQ